MRVARYVFLSLTCSLLVLSAIGWIVSVFYMHRFYLHAGDKRFALVIVAGEIGCFVGNGPKASSFLEHESQEITPFAWTFVHENTTLGFAYHREVEFMGVFFPFWFVILLMAGISALIVWRIIAARRKTAKAAFPLDLSGTA